jgi:hypothetical protein
MHNGLPLSLLDFLLVTAMLLVTPSEEWMNVTRSSPSYSYPEDGDPFDASVLSSNPLPSSSSLSSGTLDPAAIHASEATPEIERWRESVSNRVVGDNRSRYAGSIDGPVSETPSRATSRLSSNTDNHAGQGVYGIHSTSSLSLASHTLSSPQHPNRKTRGLPPVPPSQDYSYTRGPSSASSQTSYTAQRRASQDEPPPPLPPLPTSSHTSPQDQRPPISPISVPSRRATSPTSSIHSRTLPVLPLSTAKPPVPPLPMLPSRSNPASPDPGPASPPVRSRSYTHLRSLSTFPESQRNYDSPVKLPPTYSSSEQDHFVLPAPAQGMTRSLTIRTTNISRESGGMISARSASISEAPSRSAAGDGDPLDLPPAYSAVDMARSPVQLRAVNADGE